MIILNSRTTIHILTKEKNIFLTIAFNSKKLQKDKRKCKTANVFAMQVKKMKLTTENNGLFLRWK